MLTFRFSSRRVAEGGLREEDGDAEAQPVEWRLQLAAPNLAKGKALQLPLVLGDSACFGGVSHLASTSTRGSIPPNHRSKPP